MLLAGLTKANSETGFLVDIYVLKTMIYCRHGVSLRKSRFFQTNLSLNFLGLNYSYLCLSKK